MKISVVIPTYNRETTLQRAIESVLSQTLAADEVIIVDDGSTDNTHSLLKQYPHIRIISQDNRGVSSARNAGIDACVNEWIAFLDSDDEWHKDKLLEQSTFHRANPMYRISYTNEKWIRNNKELRPTKRHIKQKNPTFLSSLSHCQIGPSTVMLHKSIIEKVGCFDEAMEVCEDYDLWLRVMKRYEIPLIDKQLTIKHADTPEQLSMKYWDLDSWHVKALFKHRKHAGVEKEIRSKCAGLQKAAIKYRDQALYEQCEKWLASMLD